jgi:hypothetical protein
MRYRPRSGRRTECKVSYMTSHGPFVQYKSILDLGGGLAASRLNILKGRMAIVPSGSR